MLPQGSITEVKDESFRKYHEKNNLIGSFSGIDVCGNADHYCEQRQMLRKWKINIFKRGYGETGYYQFLYDSLRGACDLAAVEKWQV